MTDMMNEADFPHTAPCSDSAPCYRRECDDCFARHGGDSVAVPDDVMPCGCAEGMHYCETDGRGSAPQRGPLSRRPL